MDAALATRPSLIAADTTLPAAQTSTAKAPHIISTVRRYAERCSTAVDMEVEDKIELWLHCTYKWRQVAVAASCTKLEEHIG